MHGPEPVASNVPDDPNDKRPWYQLLNRYHWFVFLVAALGWLFDCLDQQLFVLTRPAAMEELVSDAGQRTAYGNYVTSIFIAGWAFGGIFFGVLGDRIGRVKTMMLTILVYSLFTGLSAFSTSVYDFALYRFLTGLGVGGEFAVGVALIAEVMPGRARPWTLGLLQACSALGNIAAAVIFLVLGTTEDEGLPTSPWRIMFMIGALPALLALVIRASLKEPEQWEKASHDGVVDRQLGSYRELFGNPTFRKHAILGLILGSGGVVGLWSVGFFTPDLIRSVQRPVVVDEVYRDLIAKAKSNGDAALEANLTKLQPIQKKDLKAPDELKSLSDANQKTINARLTPWSAYTSLMINFGAAFGMFGFGALSQRIGRKPAFVIAFLAAFVSTVVVCMYLTELWQIFVLVPIMGFCQLSLFAGYAIYFPELFPTRLRSTGTSFCYNVGRFVAVFGPVVKTELESYFHGIYTDKVESLRYAGATMCVVFLIPLLVLPFLPETKGKALPE